METELPNTLFTETGTVFGAAHNRPLSRRVAAGHTRTRQDLIVNGEQETSGAYLMAEVRVPFQGSLWGVFSGYYNWGDADIRRGHEDAASQHRLRAGIGMGSDLGGGIEAIGVAWMKPIGRNPGAFMPPARVPLRRIQATVVHAFQCGY